MCLATVYKESDDSVIFKNVSRIDVDGNYEPSNCRWTDSFTQAQNKRPLSSKNTSGYKGAFFKRRSDDYRR